MAQSKAPALPEDTGTTREASAEDKAKVFGLYADTWARLIMAVVICGLFIGLNWSVMNLIRDVFTADQELVKTAPNTQRIVDKQVLMALIGATVIQVGVAITAIVSYLFPKEAPPKRAPPKRQG